MQGSAASSFPIRHPIGAQSESNRHKGERITQAHRSHFYQRAMDNGFNVDQVVGSVFATNILLFGLATVTVLQTSIAIHTLMLAVGSALVGVLLFRFNRTSR